MGYFGPEMSVFGWILNYQTSEAEEHGLRVL